MQTKLVIADWHIAIARALGRAEARPYAPAGTARHLRAGINLAPAGAACRLWARTNPARASAISPARRGPIYRA